MSGLVRCLPSALPAEQVALTLRESTFPLQVGSLPVGGGALRGGEGFSLPSGVK